MATIKTQIEDLIGSVGDDTLITDSALNTARDIVNITPSEKLSFFLSKSASITNATATQVEYRNNISVFRGGIECIEVNKGMETKVDDSSSMFYATIDNPVYIMDNAGITIKPDPSTAPNNAFIYSITIPTVAQDTSIPLTGFPDNAEPLLIYGTAIKCAQRLLADKRAVNTNAPASPTLLSAPSITNLPNAPAIDSISNVALDFTNIAPSYISPMFSVPSYPTLDNLTLPSPPAAPSISLQSASNISNPPTYNGPVVAPDYADAENWINVEEDDTMASARINLINTKLTEYNSDLQNALNVFNKENAEYQAKLQIELQNAAMKDGKEARDIQKYQSLSTQYSNEVQAAVQKYQTTEIGEKVAKWIQEYTYRVQTYNADIQNNLNIFNADLNEYQTLFQKATKDADLSIQNNQQSIEKFAQEVNKYQSEVNTKITENATNIDKIAKANSDKLTKYSTDIQKYSIDVQDKQADFEQILKQIDTLTQIYTQSLTGYIGGGQIQQGESK